METIHSVNANSLSLELYILTYGKHHEDRISDFETDNSYWRSVHYSVQGCFIVWSQACKQFVG